jgi:hypothetical protein
MSVTLFADLKALATHFRSELQNKKLILLYAYNGTGKTRLSTEFKNLGKKPAPFVLTTETGAVLVTEKGEALGGEAIQGDTLYFNAFTEDLFSWDNDLENDHQRVLELNDDSTFFAGLREFSMDVKIGKLLERYADFNFRIEYDRRMPPVPPETQERILSPAVVFFRERDKDGAPIPIKVSRGEENLFIWCFFLALVELAMNGEQAYKWVKYLYIDDPISSLDEQNAVAVAAHLASILKDDGNSLKTTISTHHPLFFNVLYNELHRTKGNRFFFLGKSAADGTYSLIDTGDTPFFHHVACLMELHEAARSGQIFTYHFNMLRVIAEKTASFLGYDRFEDCIKKDEDDQDGILHKRLLNLLSHGKYSLYEPQEMLDENKRHFKKMLSEFTERFLFNPRRFRRLLLDGPLQAAAAPPLEPATVTTASQTDLGAFPAEPT